MEVAVLGAGVAGLTSAVQLAERGVPVAVYERSAGLGRSAASWLAGGMLAPRCEAESADASIIEPGLAGIDWWAARVPDVRRTGTLVLAAMRDASDLKRFARLTSGHRRLDAQGIGALEPDLADRFSQGLFFADEAHLDPRRALDALADRVARAGGTIRFGCAVDPSIIAADAVVDARGLDAASPGLRGVRGEMVLLATNEVRLSRPVRLLHPRAPIYVVPRGAGLFMVGATTVESQNRGAITLRSAVDLLSAAYALHPAFAEAEIVETGAACRPAFPDNLPRAVRQGRVVSVNGLYRHGFLLAPHVSAAAADLVLNASGRQAA